LNYVREEYQKNLYVKKTNKREKDSKTNSSESESKKEIPKMVKLHSVLTYQMPNKRLGCINRDRNAVLNMKKLVNHYLKTRKWLEKYKRDTKLDKKTSKIISKIECEKVGKPKKSKKRMQPSVPVKTKTECQINSKSCK